jgi:pSer/pThr/pTyr-binding forkhead associated (FHA) protein
MFKVQVRGPNGFVVEFSVDKQIITLGRDPESDIYLPSGMASRNHARAFVKGDQIYIEDLHSSNGTFVRQEKVLMPVPITAEDPVKLGDVYLRINYEAKKPILKGDSGSYSIAQRLGNRQSTVQIKKGDEAKIREMLNSPSPFASGPFKTVK